MKKKTVYGIKLQLILVFMICFNGCGFSGSDNRSDQEEVDAENSVIDLSQDSTNDNDIVLSEETIPTEKEDDTTAEDIVLENKKDTAKDQIKQEIEPEILEFVDVFGERYETEIIAEVPKHDYNTDIFRMVDGKMTYSDERYYVRQGIDVSHHQGQIDWESVKNQGYDFVILRIAYRGYGPEGNLRKDKLFEEYYKGASAAGFDIGVYIFSQAITDEEAKEEAEFVLECLNGRELQLPVFYDPESILDHKARTDDIDMEQVTKNTMLFGDIIEQAGYEPMIYSNMLWEAFKFDMRKTSKYKYWYADYEPKPQTPYDFIFWQYSSKGHVNGISTNVDQDIWLIMKE